MALENAVAGWIGHFSYAAVFLLLVACGLGAPLSEEVIVVLGGVAVGRAGHNPLWMVLTSYAGELAGDLVLFAIGRKLGPGARRLKRFRGVLTPARVARVEEHFRRHGLATLFLVRFLPGIRSPTYLMAGIGRAPASKFVVADGVAALATAPLLTLLGYHFGSRVLRGLAAATHWLLGGAIAALGLFALWWALRKRA